MTTKQTHSSRDDFDLASSNDVTTSDNQAHNYDKFSENPALTADTAVLQRWQAFLLSFQFFFSLLISVFRVTMM